MKILGVDPGSIVTGIGIIEILSGKPVLIHQDSISMNSKLPLVNRLKIIYDGCFKLIKEFKPDELAIETAFYGKNIQSTLKLGQARGVAIIAAINSNIEVFEYSPREVKKSVTGNGSSTKLYVQEIIKLILGIKENPEFIDSSDALAVALCHYYGKGNILNRYPFQKKFKSNKKAWVEFINKNPEKLFINN